MSSYMGSRVGGWPPPHIPKHKSGTPRPRPNKYADLRSSEQQGTSGQRRMRRRGYP